MNWIEVSGLLEQEPLTSATIHRVCEWLEDESHASDEEMHHATFDALAAAYVKALASGSDLRAEAKRIHSVYEKFSDGWWYA